MRSLKTVDEVIDALGGTTATARLTGRTLSAVSNWRSTKRLPADLFLMLSKALDERGAMAPPSLWGMEQRVAS
jgi:hypothetical protein